MKFKIDIVILLFFTSITLGKTSYLPPLELKSVASVDVQNFLKNQNTRDKSSIVRTSSRDVLGRVKNNFISGYSNYVYHPKKTLDVYISPLNSDVKVQPVFGRFEIKKDGELRYWLNGERVSEEIYFEILSKRDDLFFPELVYKATLTADEIEILLQGPEPVYIDVVREPIFDSYINYYTILSYSQITSLAHGNSYKGQNVGIFFDAIGCSASVGYDPQYYQKLDSCVNGLQMHPTGIAKILSNTAPEAMLYARSDCEAGCIGNLNVNAYSPKIEISSHSKHYKTNGLYSIHDKLFDNYIYHNRLISFVSSGNIDVDDTTTLVGSPAIALNAIAVGAVDPSNNNYASYSKWRNSNIGNQKPEMMNYSEFYFPNISLDFWDGYFKGTSASTPYSAATIANLLSQYSFFKRHPELIKALVISSGKIPIGNVSDYDDDVNPIVAKEIPIYSSLAWNHRFRYWNDSNSCCFDSDNKITFVENDIVANTHYRIAIAWLTSGDYVALNHSLSQDIDLRVYQNGSLLAYSISSENPFEVVDFVTSSNADLTIEILRYANAGSDNVILGYSLWNDF